jgi:hypothetical protein
MSAGRSIFGEEGLRFFMLAKEVIEKQRGILWRKGVVLVGSFRNAKGYGAELLDGLQEQTQFN